MPVKKDHRKTFGELFDSSIASVGTIVENRNIIRKTKGKRTKMGFVEYLNHLFEINEDPKRRHTDARLKAIVLDEFSHSKKTMESFADGNQTIAKLRHEYNNGCFQPSHWPPEHPGKITLLSVRYNDEGKPLNSRRPTKLATWDDMLAVLAKFPKVIETPDKLKKRIGL